MSKKTGRPSNKDLTKIKVLAREKSVEQIAKEMGRTTDWIKSYIGSDAEISETNAIIEEFRLRPEYRQLKQQFTDEEMVVFEQKYVRMMMQFKKDVLYTEESQIFMIITYDILISKNLKKMKDMDIQIKELSLRIEELRGELRSIGPSDKDRRDNIKSSLETVNGLITNLRIIQSKTDKVVTDYTSQMLKQWELIKGTRKDRIQVIENSKRTILDLLKSFESSAFRVKEGREMELMRIAGEREKIRLGKPHKYMDGNIDRPLLSADTIDMNDEYEDENELETDKQLLEEKNNNE